MARLIEEAAAAGDGAAVAPGVLDYVETLKQFHGPGGSVMKDRKTEFYLGNRVQIEEWAALRKAAAEELRSALDTIPARLREAGRDVQVSEVQANAKWRSVVIGCPRWEGEAGRLGVGVGWNTDQLLDPLSESPDPWIGVRLSTSHPNAAELYPVLVRQVQFGAAELGFASSEKGWPWWGAMRLPGGSFVIDTYVDDLCKRMLIAWDRLGDQIGSVIAG